MRVPGQQMECRPVGRTPIRLRSNPWTAKIGAVDGPRWSAMHMRPRVAMTALRADHLPDPDPGVYALYRDGTPVYVGVAEKQSLRRRFWNSHRGRGRSMTGSALRRNVAEHLAVASAVDIKARHYRPTDEDAARVVAWIDGCEVTWIACANAQEASNLEDALKAEWMPPLTER